MVDLILSLRDFPRLARKAVILHVALIESLLNLLLVPNQFILHAFVDVAVFAWLIWVLGHCFPIKWFLRMRLKCEAPRSNPDLGKKKGRRPHLVSGRFCSIPRRLPETDPPVPAAPWIQYGSILRSSGFRPEWNLWRHQPQVAWKRFPTQGRFSSSLKLNEGGIPSSVGVSWWRECRVLPCISQPFGELEKYLFRQEDPQSCDRSEVWRSLPPR